MPQAEHGRLPAPADEGDAAAVTEAAAALAKKAGLEDQVDEAVLKLLAFGARGELNPMAAMLGGIIGQEVRPPPPPHHPHQKTFWTNRQTRNTLRVLLAVY